MSKGAPERQVSFSGGELSPLLWGRTDLAEYGRGARTLKNFIVDPHGIAVTRVGTQHVAFVSGSLVARLIPFVVSGTDSLMLCFTDARIDIYDCDADNPRFVFKDAVNLSLTRRSTRSPAPSAIAVGVPPHAETNLYNIQWCQVGSVLWLFCAGMPTYTLTRLDDGTWEMHQLSTDVEDYPSWSNRPAIQNPAAAWGLGLLPLAGDATHPAREWQYQVTRIMRNVATGKTYETAPNTVSEVVDETITYGAAPTSFAVYADWPVRLYLGAGRYAVNRDGFGVINSDVIEATRIYRGRDGVFGLLDQTFGDFFVDDGAEPNYSQNPPQEFNPFLIYADDGTGTGTNVLVRTEYPATGVFFDGRLLMAATSERPDCVWASAFDDFTNHDATKIPDDADAFNFHLASAQRETIRQLVNVETLLALTSTSAWMISGTGDNGAITPLSLFARRLKGAPGAAAMPLAAQIKGSVFYIGDKRAVPYALVPSANGMQVVDIGAASRHLFEGHEIVDWAYAQEPHSILWAVRDDGVLLSVTYVPERGVLAWARHELATSGVVERIGVKPEEGGEDGVYLLVNRKDADLNDERTIERLAHGAYADIRDALHMDRAESYDGRQGYNVSSKGITITDGLSTGGDVGTEVYLVLDNSAHPAIGLLPGKRVQIWDPDGEPYTFDVTAYDSDRTLTATVVDRSVADAFNVRHEPMDWAIAVNSVSGLWHLLDEDVVVVADGEVITGLTAAAGAVTLPYYAGVIHVGIGYNCDFESMDSVQARERQKLVKNAIVELEFSSGGYVGPDLDTLTEVRAREVSDSYAVMGLKRIKQRVNIPGRWATEGRVAFRQTLPLPAMIVGITREFEHGGD